MFRLGWAELSLMLVIVLFLFSAWKLPPDNYSQSSDAHRDRQANQPTFGIRFFLALFVILALFVVAELWLWSVS